MARILRRRRRAARRLASPGLLESLQSPRVAAGRRRRRGSSVRHHGLGLRDRTRVRGAARLDARVRARGDLPAGDARPRLPDRSGAIAAPLKEQVKERGLWAAHLGPELGGQGYGQVKLGLMHEILGACEFAPPIFGNQAPDSGNSELIAIAATDRAAASSWLEPLLAGELYSAFSMTEQGTGADPTQFTTTRRPRRRRVGHQRHQVVRQQRRPQPTSTSLMAVTDPDADRHRRMSMIIVPADAPGIELRRHRLDERPDPVPSMHTQAEVSYTDVRVPAENLLGERGEAFALAQQRLGPGPHPPLHALDRRLPARVRRALRARGQQVAARQPPGRQADRSRTGSPTRPPRSRPRGC